MAISVLNILISSFPGLNLPQTLSLCLDVTTSLAELRQQVFERIPLKDNRLILTTITNKQLSKSSPDPISDLVSTPQDDFLSLRLSFPLCGGKGGFGSQLRAAGGRMSSKRKRNQGENNGSSRNLDGRRLRTVTEAKALAEYLAIKPDMEKKEREQRRRKWEQVIELAERKEGEIRSGSKGKVDGKWVEDKEEAGERTRDAVLIAMKSGNYGEDVPSGTRRVSGSSSSNSENKGTGSNHTTPQSEIESTKSKPRTYFGFDEDDEFLSSDDDGESRFSEMDDDGHEEEGKREDLPDGESSKDSSHYTAPVANKANKGKGKSSTKQTL